MVRSSVLIACSCVAWLLAPSPGHAFCGFYVAGADDRLVSEATMVVLMRQGTRTVLSMRNDYHGPPEDFAMVVPVPEVLEEDQVRVLPAEVFARVERLAAPRLVEYWEQDPCPEPGSGSGFGTIGLGNIGTIGHGAGGGARANAPLVTVEAEFAVGEYDIQILSARDSAGLESWLRANDYRIPAGAAELLRPYVEADSKFFVAKVNAARVTFADGRAVLSPLRVDYQAETFSLPVRLGLLSSGGTQDLLVHVLADDQRYELANYENVTIPTNLEVSDETRARFGEMYAALFDATLAAHPGAVVTEYAWPAANCDPCPGNPLDAKDLLTLGGDVVVSEPVRMRAPAGRRRRAQPGPFARYVLTRLHYRYDEESLGEDLVFREAAPIAGGREHLADETGTGAIPAPQNAFQGRYIIRHPWEGAITCEAPQRGRWGGPPSGAQSAPTAVMDPARGARGDATTLSALVKTAFDASAAGATPAAGAESSASSAPPTAGAGARPTTGAGARPTTGAGAPDGAGGCGCRTSPGQSASAALWLLAIGALLRRRR